MLRTSHFAERLPSVAKSAKSIVTLTGVAYSRVGRMADRGVLSSGDALCAACDGPENSEAYLNNPTSYQPKTPKTGPRDEKAAPKAKGGRTATAATAPASPAVPQVTSSAAKLVVYPFPVRPDVFAELKLPADLTLEEANRLSAFLNAVAMADGGGGGSQ